MLSQLSTERTARNSKGLSIRAMGVIMARIIFAKTLFFSVLFLTPLQQFERLLSPPPFKQMLEKMRDEMRKDWVWLFNSNKKEVEYIEKRIRQLNERHRQGEDVSQYINKFGNRSSHY